MKKILAIGVASAALFGVASLASAQEDCLNGWRMIKDQLPIRCDMPPAAVGPAPILGGVAAAVTAPVEAIAEAVEEPLYTGSIVAAPVQEDCLNGWRMIKDQVPVRCDLLPSAFGPRESPVEQFVTGAITAPVNAITAPVEAITAPVEEQLYTGSIAAAPVQESEMPPRPGAPESPPYAFAASREECQPGQYWMMELSSGNRPVACE